MTYDVRYAVAWVNAAVGVIAGVLAAAWLTVHPSWLTQDVAATCGVIVPISVGLAALLPQINRTPAQREANYLAAAAGKLPDDLVSKPL